MHDFYANSRMKPRVCGCDCGRQQTDAIAEKACCFIAPVAVTMCSYSLQTATVECELRSEVRYT